MEHPVRILDASGNPLPPSRGHKIGMLNTGHNGIAYDAADVYGEHMAAWSPNLGSPDGELNPYRDRIVARVRDAVRNDGWAAGAVTRILDNAIGAHFRPIAKPDHRFLATYSGNKSFDASWADEFGRAVEAHYRIWANDHGRYCDVERSKTMPQIMALAFRHYLIDADSLAQVCWVPERIGMGRARYATAVQVIDPDRLSNPQQNFDQNTMRGGVVIDDYGAATGYYIRQAHQGDWYAAAKSLTWQLVPRETAWGRPVMVHYFDHERAAQHRGGAGILSPVLQRLKMLIKYDGTELDAAIINAIFAAYVESPFDHQLLQGAFDGSQDLSGYQKERGAFHQESAINIGGVKVLQLYPGEKFGMANAARPNGNFEAFEGAALRNIATGIGISAQQLSNNWSDVNYSSARAAMLEAWKTLTRRRDNFARGFADPIFTAWLEEAMESDDFPLPANAPEFVECRAAYARCRWMGPGRGWIDPLKERQGSVLGMDAGLTTLEHETAESSGEDYEDILDQRAREIAAFKSRGMVPPTWAQIQPQITAQNVADAPEAE